MILVTIQHISTAQTLVDSAVALANQLKKSLGLLMLVDSDESSATCEKELEVLLPHIPLFVRNASSNTILSVCEELEASFLVLQLPDHKTKSIRRLLNACRELRIPYLFFGDSFAPLDLSKVILPVGFLEEELEKAQFASAFGRFCSSEIHLLLANDYGSKAAVNAEKMKSLFDKFQLNYTLTKGKKDSFRVEKEALQVAKCVGGGIIIVSASRDYGLDDILFGPKEFHVLKKTTLPVLLVNPRGDLYALCD